MAEPGSTLKDRPSKPEAKSGWIKRHPRAKAPLWLGWVVVKNLLRWLWPLVFYASTFLPFARAAAPDAPGPPAWAREAVWYQIFPERFFNGDPAHDPVLADQAGAYPHDAASPWRIHPWTSDWYEKQPYEQSNGKDIWFNLQRRRYGGDLQGVLDKLGYLQRLGVTALYLNPVFAAPSSHKYDGLTYHHVDPAFGPDPAGDRRLMAEENPADARTWAWTAADRLLLRLVKEVHRRGMRIILDGVFNHMSIKSWPFQDLVRNGRQSAFRDWFNVLDWNKPGPLGIPFRYVGWFGVPELPELKQDENGTVAGPREYIFAATRRWMDPDGDGSPSDGIDGWRLDVAFCIKHPFWKAWRQVVKGINPQAYLVAEVVDTPENCAPYLQGDEFDAVMNYNFAFACWRFFVNGPSRLSAKDFDTALKRLREAFPPAVAGGLQNLLDSHDTTRFATLVHNAERAPFTTWAEFFSRSKADNPSFDPGPPSPTDREFQRLAVAFQMTYLGAPMVYYGDEAGMWGANDPCCRKPMVWNEFQYQPEVFKPDGSRRLAPAPVAFDAGLFAWYRQLIALRRNHPVLRTGDFTTLQAGGDGLYAFTRSGPEEKITVVLNRDAEAKTFSLAGAPSQPQDLLDNGKPVPAAPDGRITLTVGPRSVRIVRWR